MTRRRARATVPIRRMRLPPLANRSRDHRLNLLLGVKSQPGPGNFDGQGVDTSVARFADPLFSQPSTAVVGGRCQARQAATSRRFRKRRQPKNSMTKVQELTGPIPGSLRSWATCIILEFSFLRRCVFSFTRLLICSSTMRNRLFTLTSRTFISAGSL